MIRRTKYVSVRSLGLLLVSPAFLGSEFITKKELKAFVGSVAKPVVPVMLRRINRKRHNLKGLENFKIFELEVDQENLRSFAQCGHKQEYDFAYELHEQVEARLDKIY